MMTDANPHRELLGPNDQPLKTMDDLYRASATPEKEKAWADFVAGLQTFESLRTWTPR